MTFLIYCLGVFFGWYVFNCSDIAQSTRVWILSRAHNNVAYVLGCSLCTTFWVTLSLWAATIVPLSYVFAAPVVNLFLAKTLDHLNK